MHSRHVIIHNIHIAMNLDQLYWELSVLSRSIAYSNLSQASRQVGLSQPQLSRIVARIETELGILLLDRGAKRKSAWTSVAFKLVDAYLKASKQLSSEIENTVSTVQMKQVKVACLEGLTSIAIKLCDTLIKKNGVKLVELDVHDLSDLEEQFVRANYDLIFSSREPSQKKHRFTKVLGYQSFEKIQNSNEVRVMSLFEYSSLKSRSKDESPMVISNSLQVKKDWIATVGGRGVVPSSVRPGTGKDKNEHSVLLVGSELLTQKFWDETIRLFKI